jgi:MazG family protein
VSDDQKPVLEALGELLEVIDRLRSPGGCPWDREQTESSMAPHLLEEACEAVEALRDGDAGSASEELGDVLMNLAMIARIASESGRYDLGQVARGVANKLIRRHPHVFGDVEAADADAVLANWERIKLAERAPGKPPKGVLDGLPASLPALLKAHRIGEKASRVGFDWPSRAGPRAKVDEELAELDAALASGDAGRVAAELGDLLFAIVNLARHARVDPELALGGTIARFRRRFEHVERALGARLATSTLDELEAAWERAKRAEG